jgi:hypothetical protein
MTDYTEEKVEEIVREAVAKTERSFGGTFKRLKSENEELRTACEGAAAERDSLKTQFEQRISELEKEIGLRDEKISGLAVRGEVQRQLREKDPIPERFLDVNGIDYSDDPETLCNNVAEAIGKAEKEFREALGQIGIDLSQKGQPNPTNPPTRQYNPKKTEARDVLDSMTSRGLLRSF